MAVDGLGSVRWNAQTGNHTYYPYGSEYSGDSNDTDTEKYATYTRDSVSNGLDYAVNRYYYNAWGRFVSPDPSTGSIRLSDSQSWNRYLYMGDDPINGNDPTGLDDICGPNGTWNGEGRYDYGAVSPPDI